MIQGIKVIGAGLAGCEAAWQCARRGIEVELYEMRPLKSTPAHQTDKFGELVCSNSLKSESENTAPGCSKRKCVALARCLSKSPARPRSPRGMPWPWTGTSSRRGSRKPYQPNHESK